jgi:S1-C subfamily serine protease
MASLAPSEEDPLDAYSKAVVAVAEKVGPSVVSIARSSKRGPTGAGSGLIFTPDGYVLTNAHVVAGAHGLEVGFTDGTSARADVVGLDHATDLAVVRVKPGSAASHATFGSSAALRVGQVVHRHRQPARLCLHRVGRRRQRPRAHDAGA